MRVMNYADDVLLMNLISRNKKTQELYNNAAVSGSQSFNIQAVNRSISLKKIPQVTSSSRV